MNVETMPTPAIPPHASGGICPGRTGRPTTSAETQNAVAVAEIITAPATVGPTLFLPPCPTPDRRSSDPTAPRPRGLATTHAHESTAPSVNRQVIRVCQSTPAA